MHAPALFLLTQVLGLYVSRSMPKNRCCYCVIITYGNPIPVCHVAIAPFWVLLHNLVITVVSIAPAYCNISHGPRSNIEDELRYLRCRHIYIYSHPSTSIYICVLWRWLMKMPLVWQTTWCMLRAIGVLNTRIVFFSRGSVFEELSTVYHQLWQLFFLSSVRWLGGDTRGSLGRSAY